MNRSLNGMRAIAHIYILISHYRISFNEDIKSEISLLSISIKHIIRLTLMYAFAIFFVLNGISSGKYLSYYMNKSSNNFKAAIKFYYQRLAMILPLLYFYYIAFYILVKLVFKNHMLEKMLFDSLLPNLLLISNIFNVVSNVMNMKNFWKTIQCNPDSVPLDTV